MRSSSLLPGRQQFGDHLRKQTTPRMASRGPRVSSVSPAGRASHTAAGGEPTWTRLRTESPRTSGAEKLPASGAWGKGSTAARSSSTATDYRGPSPGRSESSGCESRAAASPRSPVRGPPICGCGPAPDPFGLASGGRHRRTLVRRSDCCCYSLTPGVGVAGLGTSAAWPRELSSQGS